MPELPEVEITARRLDAALRGAAIESAVAPGVNALKTYDPPLTAIEMPNQSADVRTEGVSSASRLRAAACVTTANERSANRMLRRVMDMARSWA